MIWIFFQHSPEKVLGHPLRAQGLVPEIEARRGGGTVGTRFGGGCFIQVTFINESVVCSQAEATTLKRELIKMVFEGRAALQGRK